MKRVQITVITVLTMILSGCAYFDNQMAQFIEEEANIKNDVSYRTYQNYVKQGKLDQDGYYIDSSEEETIPVEDPNEDETVAVTFSQNTYLKTDYSLDKEGENVISTNPCKLKVGDHIYCDVEPNSHAPSSMYEFSGFRISEIDEDGSRNYIETVSPEEDGLILAVDDSYIGKQIVIDPVGAYKSRQIILKDSYLDSDEEEHELDGVWEINYKKVQDNTINISPTAFYAVRYSFDSSKYFYLSSDPEALYVDEEGGEVVFERGQPTDQIDAYSVQLHKYGSADLISNQDRMVRINGSEERIVKAQNLLNIPNLKYGDHVEIQTDKEWKELENCQDLIWLSEEESGDEKLPFKYAMVYPQKDGEFHFDPNEYSYEHGTIQFFCFGEEVNSLKVLAPGSRITYQEKTADEGYWLGEGKKYIVVTTEEETREKLEAIRFTEKIKVKIHLDQPDYGGRIQYYVNDQRVDSDTCMADSGTKIRMNFFPWEGWACEYFNGEEYIVTSDPEQHITIQNSKYLEQVFKESTDHRPELKVILNKSLGKDIKIKVSAPLLSPIKWYSYESRFLQRDFNIPFTNKKIGTEQGIELSIKGALPSNSAIKVRIEKVGEKRNGKKKEKVIRKERIYIEKLNEKPNPIEIYNYASPVDKEIWYKSVKMEFSLVSTVKVAIPEAPSNMRIVVRDCDTSKVYKNGDLAESTQKVTITITAQNGEILAGKGVKKGACQKTVKLDHCYDEIQNMLKNVYIKKY